MNELELARVVKTHLDDGAEHLPESVLARIREARARAVSLRKESDIYPVPPSGAMTKFLCFLSSRGPIFRNVAAVLVISLGVVFALHVNRQSVEALADIDSAVLTDVLPIDAFTDKGFDAWLKKTSVQRSS